MKEKILISAPYMLKEKEKIQAMLSPYPHLDITWAQVRERLEESDLLKMIEPFSGVICGDDRFSVNVYEKAKNLRVIVKWGTGIDSLNQEEAKKRGIKLFRTPGAFTDPVADSTLSYILAFCRGIKANDDILKQGQWEKPQGYALFEKTVGIIGFGEIGQAVAKRLMGFGPSVLAHDCVEIDSKIVNELKVTMTSLEQILLTCDFITLHCDLNESSQYILDEMAFAQMKKKPYIINTARGPLIKESALLAALDNEDISGAALDVFEEEPLDKDHSLRKRDNTLLAAHNSNSSPACWDRVHKNSIEMLIEGLK